MSLLRNATAATLLAALAAGAHAGQIFSFQNPIVNGSYNNAMFESTALFAGNTSPIASIKNIYTGNVALDVATFNSAGAYIGSNSYAAKYYVSNLGNPLSNDLFQGNKTSGVYATGNGAITFVDPTTSTVLLKITFDASTLTAGNLAAAGTIGFSGSLLTTGETGSENASFGFPNRYTASGNQSDAVGHLTGTFTSSIGRINPVPEPSSIAALAVGGFALLRRKRRA